MGKYLKGAQKDQGTDKRWTYDRVILDKPKHEFGYLGAKFGSMRCVAFSLVDYFPLELGEILRYSCDPEVDSLIGLMHFSGLPLTRVGIMSQIR